MASRMGRSPQNFCHTIKMLLATGNYGDDPVNLLMLAAAQHSMRVAFHDLLKDPTLQTYMCSVEIGRLVEGCIGYGPTKRDAKLNAAEEAIHELTLQLVESQASSPSTSSNMEGIVGGRIAEGRIGSHKNETASSSFGMEFNSSQSDGSYLSKHGRLQSSISLAPSFNLHRSLLTPTRSTSPISSNPIGELQELTAARSWPAPKYDEVDHYGPPNCPTFVITCQLRSKITEGTDSTKKGAKKKAAEEMLRKISANGSPLKRKASCLKGSETQKSYQRSSSDSYPVSSSSGRVRTLPVLSSLENMGISNGFYLAKLDKKATAENWDITWYDFPEKGYSGNRQCFVKITADPVIVFCGSGHTQSGAHGDAAKNALKYLKT